MEAVQLRSRAQWMKGVVHQYGFRMVFGEIPRLLYGNDAGLVNNVRARRELSRYRALAPELGRVTNSGAEILKRDGYVRLQPRYDPHLLAVIRTKFHSAIDDASASRGIGPRLREAIRGIVNPLDRIPEVEQLLTPEMRDLICAYYGSHFRVDHVRLWRNNHVSGEFAQQDVYSNLWHNDQEPVTMIKLFVYLTDGVTRETGATRFHTIPNTKQIMRAGYMRRRAILPPARRLLEDERRIMYFEGGVGDACILNPSLCLHRAGVPKVGCHRDIAQFTFLPSDRPLSSTWPAELPPDREVSA